MSWLPCRCGYIFHDNTDFLSFKAYFRADQDMDDYFTSVEAIMKNLTLSMKDKEHEILCVADFHFTNRLLYQCPSCGRLYVEDNDRHFHCFMPEPEEDNHRLLESAEGQNWKGMLSGDWRSPKPEYKQHPGDIIINVNSKERGCLYFEDYDELKQKFDELFQELKEKNLIRSASLWKNQEQIFRWLDKKQLP